MSCVGQVISLFTLLSLLSACVTYPAEPDPHRETHDPLDMPGTHLEDLEALIGYPDFKYEESTMVWIDSRFGPGYLYFYVLSADLDESKKVVSSERNRFYPGAELCLDNGICFTKNTLEIPLVPSVVDEKVKKYELDPEACQIYVYRDPQGLPKPDNDYVHVSLSSRETDNTGEVFQEIQYAAASVPGGFSYWKIPAPAFVQIEADPAIPLEYDFRFPGSRWTKHVTRTRPNNHFEFSCQKNEIRYVRLFVPDSAKQPPELALKKAHEAQETILNLHLLFELDWRL